MIPSGSYLEGILNRDHLATQSTFTTLLKTGGNIHLFLVKNLKLDKEHPQYTTKKKFFYSADSRLEPTSMIFGL